MKKHAIVLLFLPLAACATQQQNDQSKTALLAKAEAYCGGTRNLECLNVFVARNAVNTKVVRQADGSLLLTYGTFIPHSVGGQVMTGDNAAAAASMGAANGNTHAPGSQYGVPIMN